MNGNGLGRDCYIRRVLAGYRQTPGATGRIRSADRLLAAKLYERGVPIDVVENAFTLGAARRLYRKDPTAPALPPVRSLHYFLPLIEEISRLKINPAYFRYLRYRIDTFEEAKQAFLQALESRKH
jgi:hypothetical protein